ncbi:CbrC family protein [Streptomyces sp. NPDC096191]|uniref:CbrC family protein n=1 Tax=Streptomyces sp. NPDC096191 TaxID=3155426 RepID=UPI00331ECC17
MSDDVLHEVTRRTPGFHAWQDPHWLVHCHDESQVERILTHLGEGMTAMLFRCTVCGVHLAYADAS